MARGILATLRRARYPTIKTWLHFAAVAVIFALGIWLGHLATANGAVRSLVADYGYIGIFIVAIVSGFNIAIPVPAIAFLPAFLASGLDFWTVITVITVGVSLADCIAFLLGRTGRKLVPAKYTGTIRKLERIRERYHWAPLALLLVWATIAPLPNEVIVIPLGLMGYRLYHIVPMVIVGNFIFNTLTGLGILTVFGAL